MTVVDVALDMETRDPDDVLTLCLLATHPAVRLVAVTVNPGTPEQIGVVRTVLDRLNVDVPVGARGGTGDAVSPFHRAWLGQTPAAQPDEVAHELLARVLTDDTVLLTAAPLHNLRLLLNNHPSTQVRRWVAQGGFAGDNVVPEADRLAKFAGSHTRESFNFGHDVKGALLALRSDRVLERRLVSKNVTHKVLWDSSTQSWTGTIGLTPGARLARDAMAVYLRSRPGGKLLHDPMAAVAVLDPAAFGWAEVEVFREEGRWGSRTCAGTNTFISVALDVQRALRVLMMDVMR